ncbi:hypothetical protein GRI97_01080 [Altererythrobacter xixiisoli]|uniref:Uncharacterized protein n=1 Tax=Croceibacterium xixiisoli TaxID=1476466 RepID=A0A6I4TR32_9SPHN|nr:hypothetical protein [Croceibacterium xixiisoli]MXO97580.1 hypothetical protein [Croceibacterium xixiisoli]
MAGSRFSLGRLGLKILSGIVGGTATIAMPAAAQSISPEQAPAAWLAYADHVTRAVIGWIEADSEPAVRLRTYLDAMRSDPAQPTAPLLLKIWIDPAGIVSRIEHAPFAHAQANADCHTLLAGRSLDQPPPRGMLLPLRVMVQLPPRQDPEVQQGF